MTVPVQTTYTASIANGATTVFPYGFKIAAAEDLAVTVDGVIQSSGYTVSGVGNPAGGNVTFTVAPANGAKVLRYLAPVLKRETDYQQFGDWLAAVVNLDFDRIWLTLQTLQQNDIRSLKLPVDTAVDQEIFMTAAQRANKAVIFDGDGNFTVSADSYVDQTAASAASAAAAAASASSASASATSASGSASSASTSATNAENSASAASTSATNAAASAAAADVAKMEWQGAWTTTTAYALNDVVSQGGSSYICLVAHTSGTFATDLAALKWELVAQRGNDGAGSGDLLAANNLSDVASAATAFGNIKQAASETATGVVELATTAEATTGTDTQRAVTPAGLAAALAASTSKDLVARDQIALTNLRLLLNTAVATGALVQGKQWELATDEWGGTSTNETFNSGSPAYYGNLVSMGSLIGYATGSVLSNLTDLAGSPFDGVTSEAAAICDYKTNAGADGVLVGKDWGSGNTKTITGFKVYGSNNAGLWGASASNTIKLQGSTDNFVSSVVTLYSGTHTDANGLVASVSGSIDTSTAYRYHRVAISGNGSETVYLAEVEFFDGGTRADMTLIPGAAVSVSAAPTYMDAYFLYKDDSGSAVLGTDLTVELSRDGGTTWTTATLTTLASFDGTYSAIKARADVSGQPSGTSMTCRIKTLNNKAQRVAAPALYAE